MNSQNISQKICLQEISSNVKLDLFKLHDKIEDDKPEKWIVAKGIFLKPKIALLIEEIGHNQMSESQLVKHLMNCFDISISSAERLVYLKKEWFPLVFIEELLLILNKEDAKYEVQENIEFLKVSQPPLRILKANKELTLNLCRIAGAHAADGTISKNYFSIVDGYKSNMVAFQNWLVEEFNLNTKLVRVSDKEWRISFHNKIFTRYLKKIFEFPNGSKYYVVREPEIIKHSAFEFRQAFALGVLTFEAGVGIKNQVEFCVASKTFRDDISKILTLYNIKHVSMEKRSGTYYRLWSNKLSKENSLAWLGFFEKGTEKWLRIKESCSGFSNEVYSYEQAREILNRVHPKKSASKISIVEVLDILKEYDGLCRYEIVEKLIKNNTQFSGGKWAHSIKHYLDILLKVNMIIITKKTFGKKKSFGNIIREIYSYNEDVSSWRLPAVLD